MLAPRLPVPDAAGDEAPSPDAAQRIETAAKTEPSFLPRVDYVRETQSGGMTVASREKIVGWYEEMGAAFGLGDHLLDLATNFLDRALSARSVSADEFRRDAVAAIYLAAKVEGAAAFKAADVAALTRGNVTAEDLIAAEADLIKTLQWRTHAPTVAVAVLDAIKFHEVDVADEVSAFARVARASYELVGAPPTLVAAACVVAASPDARAVAEAASALDTPWGGSPSRVQSAAALLRAARAKRAGDYAPPPHAAFVPVETPDDCATVTPDPPTRSPSPYSKH